MTSPRSEGWTLDDVLRWVNGVRADYDLEPLAELPKGVPGESSCCVIARAIEGRAFDDECLPAYQSPLQPGDFVGYPGFIENFVLEFDSGAYPELEDAA